MKIQEELAALCGATGSPSPDFLEAPRLVDRACGDEVDLDHMLQLEGGPERRFTDTMSRTNNLSSTSMNVLRSPGRSGIAGRRGRYRHQRYKTTFSYEQLQ